MKKICISFLVLSYFILFGYIGLLHVKTNPHYNFLSFYTGKVEIKKSDASIEPAEIKMPLFDNDTIQVFSSSRAWLQLGVNALIEVKEDSLFRMDTLPESLKSSRRKNAFELLRGGVNVFVEKLTGGGSFSMTIGNMTLAVRGTLFSVDKYKNRFTFMVKKGEIEITQKGEEATSFFIKQGEKVIFENQKLSRYVMNKKEREHFTGIEALWPPLAIYCTPRDSLSRYFSWRLDIPDPLKEKEKKNKEEKGSEERKNEKEDKEENLSRPEGVRLGVLRLNAAGADSKEAGHITAMIYRHIAGKQGREKVIYRPSGGYGKSVNRQLMGRMNRLGAKYILAIRVINSETGTVLFDETAVLPKGEKRDEIIKGMADKISANKSIWQK